MYLIIISVILGMVGLWLFSDRGVDAARRIAREFGISELVVGLTITSIGTSLPEIFTNVMAGMNNLKGIESSGIAVGDIIGSCMFQILIVLGICGLIATLYSTKKSICRDGSVMLGSAIVVVIAGFNGYISQMEGVILILLYVFYIVYVLRDEKRIKYEKKEVNKKQIVKDFAIVFAALFLVVISAKLVVENGVIIAENLNVSEFIIGLFIGVGTALPELSVSIQAIRKKAGTLGLGNLIGSNITNPLLALGTGAAIAGFTVSRIVISFDFIFWIVATAVVFLLLLNNMNLSKKESIILILMYIIYLYVRFAFV